MPARRPPDSRHERIGQAYALHAERLHRVVGRLSSHEHRHLAQDACAFAWQKLVARDDIAVDADERYIGWLFTVARREHWRLARESARDLSLDRPLGVDDGTERDSLVGALRSPAEVQTLTEQMEQLQLLKELPLARRQALLLLGAGHSYAEIGSLMGLSQTQVNRYLSEGRQKVRALHRERSDVADSQLSRDRGGRVEPCTRLDGPSTYDLELGLDL